MFAITLKEMNEMHSLEKVLAIFKAEKGDSVGHHPNVATTTVIIGLSPRTIFIFHCQDFVRRTSGMRSSIVTVSMIP